MVGYHTEGAAGARTAGDAVVGALTRALGDEGDPSNKEEETTTGRGNRIATIVYTVLILGFVLLVIVVFLLRYYIGRKRAKKNERDARNEQWKKEVEIPSNKRRTVSHAATTTTSDSSSTTKNDQDDNDNDDMKWLTARTVQHLLEPFTITLAEANFSVGKAAEEATTAESLEEVSPDESSHIEIPSRGLLASSKTRLVPNDCALCDGKYKCGEQITWSSNPKCEHVFHKNCIADFMLQQNCSCPDCPNPFILDRRKPQLEELL